TLSLHDALPILCKINRQPPERNGGISGSYELLEFRKVIQIQVGIEQLRFQPEPLPKPHKSRLAYQAGCTRCIIKCFNGRAVFMMIAAYADKPAIDFPQQ